jgi:hypothetical protein
MDRPGGGVAILIHKSLQFSPLSLPHLETIEVVGVSIALRNNRNKLIDILSVYIPNGNSCSEEELTSLTTGRNNFIIGGDFKGHHGRWETSCNLPNQSGRALASIYLGALLDATKSSGIILTRTRDTIKSEPSPPCWDVECRKAVAMA